MSRYPADPFSDLRLESYWKSFAQTNTVGRKLPAQVRGDAKLEDLTLGFMGPQSAQKTNS